MSQIRVFCPQCKGGDNAIWEGSNTEWLAQLAQSKPPDWANYAWHHETAHNHRVLVEYRGMRTVTLIGAKPVNEI